MSPENPETWHVDPLALRLASAWPALAALVAGVIVVYLVVRWWTEWR